MVFLRVVKTIVGSLLFLVHGYCSVSFSIFCITFILVIASNCNIKKLPICCTSTHFIWLVSEKHRLIGNRIINKSANSLTGSAWEATITGRTQTCRRVWNISKLLHFMEMRLHKKKFTLQKLWTTSTNLSHRDPLLQLEMISFPET